jgi:hypothetical protein
MLDEAEYTVFPKIPVIGRMQSHPSKIKLVTKKTSEMFLFMA